MNKNLRVLLLANNMVGLEVARFLRHRKADIGGLVLHPPGKQKFGDEIRVAVGLPDVFLFDGDTLDHAGTQEVIRHLECDIAVSIFFGYILRPSFLSLFPQGVVNLHPSLLPYNRGASPNIWGIVGRTPAGVTLHQVDKGVDTGPILAQREVQTLPTDTGKSLYERLERECVRLFQEAWPRLIAGELEPQPQRGEPTTHRAADVGRIDEIDLDVSYKAGDLINILRARTFPPYHGAYFVQDGQKVYLRLELSEEF